MYYGYEYFMFNLHPYTMSIYSVFFVWYYRRIFSKSFYCASFIFAITYFLIILFLIKKPYDIKIVLPMSLCFLLLPLIWIYKQFQLIELDDKSILSKHLFWISSSMILWSIFFILKMLPLYFIYIKAREFSFQIDYIFQYVNITFYLSLYRSLFCKT